MEKRIMEKINKGMILNNIGELVKLLAPRVNEMCEFLCQTYTISVTMRDDLLQTRKDPESRAADVLNLIVNYGPLAFQTFYCGALLNKLYSVADILKPVCAPHKELPQPVRASNERNDQDNLVFEMPETWPSDEHMTKDIQVKHVIPKSNMETEFRNSLYAIGPKVCYTVKKKTRGRLLLINNEQFGSSELDREGSSQDRDRVSVVFTQLGFSVQVKENLTAEEMNAIIEAECNQNHSGFDCFIFILLSHGQKDKVYGTDRRSIKLMDIMNKFCSIPSLYGKPKLFFIQACRGDREDPGVPLSSAASATPESVETDDRNSDINLQDCIPVFDEDDENMDVQDTYVPTLRIPSDADYFLAMSTVSEKVSYRRTGLGTWFMQAVVLVFENCAHKHELNTLMTMVNDLVCKAETEDKKKQVAEKRDTLRKTFCFFPGLHEDSLFLDSPL